MQQTIAQKDRRKKYPQKYDGAEKQFISRLLIFGLFENISSKMGKCNLKRGKILSKGKKWTGAFHSAARSRNKADKKRLPP